MYLRFLFNLVHWILIALGAALLSTGLTLTQQWLKIPLLFLGSLLIVLGLTILWWHLRPNTAQIKPDLQIESWDVVNDKFHNSNTDLIHWKGYFYLVHAASSFHFASTGCQLVLHRSVDAHTWETLAYFKSPNEDIRDPKLAVINDRLFLYALVNSSFDPEPYTTVYAVSSDLGNNWSPLTRLEHEGWLFWKPKTTDGQIWYAAAYWHEHGKSALFSTNDGINWKMVSTIYDRGNRNDETDIEFLPDGKMLAVARLEGDFKAGSYSMFFGHPSGGTLIARSRAGYANFETMAISPITRMDGLAIFSYSGRVFVVGRFQPRLSQPFTRQGSIFARKRTAIFEVRDSRLIWLSDLPSAGDTSYAGVVLLSGYLYISYYTSNIQRDPPWIVGMFNPTTIRIARIELERLLMF